MRKQIKKNKLRHYRRLMNWTQLELAEAVGSRQQYIGTYERGIIGTPNRLKPKIASVLGLPIDVIFPEYAGLTGWEGLDEKTNPKG